MQTTSRWSAGVDAVAGRWVRDAAGPALVAFAASVTLLGGATSGRSDATAADPRNAYAALVTEGFVPVVAGASEVAPYETEISGVSVTARLSSDEASAPVIAVDLRNGRVAAANVECDVKLAFRIFGPMAELARVAPTPEVRQVFSRALSERVDGGETRTVTIALPPGALTPPPSSTEGERAVAALLVTERGRVQRQSR